MNGQWLGTFTGTNDGAIILNIEKIKNEYQGQIISLDKNTTIPSVTAKIKINLNENKVSGELSDFKSIDPDTHFIEEWKKISPRYLDGNCIPTVGTLNGEITTDKNKILGEWYKEFGKQYLTIIELSANEKNKALAELRYMGITASSLFPGLDGIFRALKETYFNT